MSDSIQSVRYIPPVHRLKHKGKTGDKKDDKGGNQDFSKHLPSEDEDVSGKGSSHENEQKKDSGQHKPGGKDSLQSRKESGLDDTCGSILDAEV